MCLAQEHKAVTPVVLEPTTPPSRDKHSVTSATASLSIYFLKILFIMCLLHIFKCTADYHYEGKHNEP